MNRAVLSCERRPERPCCVRLEIKRTFPLSDSLTISYTPSGYATGVFLSRGISENMHYYNWLILHIRSGEGMLGGCVFSCFPDFYNLVHSCLLKHAMKKLSVK